MASDLISDVLRSVRLDATVYFEVQMSGRWGIDVAASDAASFHYVTSGEAWARVGDRPWLRIAAGRTIVLPHGDAQSISSAPEDGPGGDGRALFDRMDDAGVVRLTDEAGTTDELAAASAASPGTRIICGHFATDRTLDHPLLSSLPSVITAPAERSAAWAAVAELALARSRELAPGSSALTDRLAEVLLIDVLANVDPADAGFVRSLRDPVVASALHALHDEPDRAWTIASLANEIAVSPSTVSHRFADMVGESPMRYLTRWRLHLAAGLFRDTALTNDQVARRVGYQTPFSLSKAFTREFGLAPSVYRHRRHTELSRRWSPRHGEIVAERI